MQRKPRKKELPTNKTGEVASVQIEIQAEGLPSQASVTGQQTLVSPQGRQYTILKTTEVDASDQPKRKASKARQ